jgi:putative transposase
MEEIVNVLNRGAPGLKHTEKTEIVPLNVWTEGKLEAEVARADIVRIEAEGEMAKVLAQLAKICRDFVNEEFQRRSKIYEETGEIDVSIMPAYRNPSYFSFRRILGSRNFDEALRFVSEQYRNFSKLLEMKRRGELPEYIDPKPPRDFKPLALFVRFDNYEIDSEQRTIKLGYYGEVLSYKGNLRWFARGRQGRLMIKYNEAKKRWYAHIASYVTLRRDNVVGYKCGVDLGQRFLAVVATENGYVLMYKGSKLAWDYLYFKEKISQSDRLYSIGEIDLDFNVERKRIHNYKMKVHREEAFKNLASHLIRTLKQLGIAEIYVGYPHNITKDKPYEYNVSFWSYWKLMERIAITAENYGIAVYALDESGTSKHCAYHGIEGQRSPRGLLHCPMGHTIHSDVNAALNILKKAGGKLPTVFKTQSFIVTPRGIKPVESRAGGC